MYKQLRTLALVSAIALSLVTVSGSAFADSAQEITNARHARLRGRKRSQFGRPINQ